MSLTWTIQESLEQSSWTRCREKYFTALAGGWPKGFREARAHEDRDVMRLAANDSGRFLRLQSGREERDASSGFGFSVHDASDKETRME